MPDSAEPPLPSPEEWARIEQLFDLLSKLPRAEARARLDALTDVSSRIRREVAAMLERSTDGASPLEDGMAMGAELFVDGDPRTHVGRNIGPYRCEEMLPRGGMGVVYRGVRQRPTREAAVKILHLAWIDPLRLRDFDEEIETLATLSHPGIAQLYEGGTSEGTPWFAMEYVHGRRIDEWLASRKTSVREVLQLFLQLCQAIQYANERNVFHCDLKPSNVLVTDDGRVKVIDFGIAKRYAAPPIGNVRTERSFIQMTLAYAAPEQVEGMRPTAHTDVYALGVMLHELLVGERPYDVSSVNTGNVLPLILDGYPWDLRRWNRIRDLGRFYANDLNTIVCGATHPDREKRYGSAAAMSADIEAFLAKRPLKRGDVGSLYHAQKFVRRRGRAIAIVATLAIAATTALVSHNRSLAAARDIAIEEAARGTRVRAFLEEMFNVQSPTSFPAESTRVGAIVARGLKEANGATNDPAHRLYMLWSLGLIGERLSTLDRADTIYKTAIALSDSLYGPNHPETLRLRIRPARLMFLRGKPDSARVAIESLDSLARRYAPAGHPVIGELALLRGNMLYAIGRAEEAIPYLQRAVDFEQARDSNSIEFAQAWRELGQARFYASDLARADTALRRAYALMARRMGVRHYEVAYIEASLATIAARLGDLAQAERLQRDALSILQEWNGNGHYLTAMAEGTLSQTLTRQGRYREAIPLLREAMTYMARYPETDPSTPNYAMLQSTHAIALNGIGERSGVIAEFDSAISTLKATIGPTNPIVLRTEGSRALALMTHGKLDSAVVLFRDLVARSTTAHGPRHTVVLELSIGLGESLVRSGAVREGLELVHGTLPAIDSLLTPKSDVAQRGRRALARGYYALGDTVRAEQWRREAGDSVEAFKVTAAARKGAGND